jgi:transposase-like protein
LAAWRASGDTVAEFCRRQRVSPATFYYWKRRLDDGAGESQEVQAADFLPVQLRAGDSSGRIEIELPNGVLVRLPSNVSAGTLREAIQASAGASQGGPAC